MSDCGATSRGRGGRSAPRSGRSRCKAGGWCGGTTLTVTGKAIWRGTAARPPRSFAAQSGQICYSSPGPADRPALDFEPAITRRKKRDGFRDSVDRRQCEVLVFDRQHVVITACRERLTEPAPPGFVVSTAESHVIPSPMRDILTRPDLDPSVARQRIRFEARVLRVHMIDGQPQRGDRGERIGAHPQQMTWVKIDADRLADRVAQSEESTDAID